MSNEVALSDTTQPLNQLPYGPCTIVYDPGQHIHNAVRQLYPFGSDITICRGVEELIVYVRNAPEGQIFLLMIFSDKDHREVRHFFMRHIPNQEVLHSLYLIFPNGLQLHDTLMDPQLMPKLRWCRSFTTELIQDIYDVCAPFCNESISFYKQRMIIAEDAVTTGNGAEGVVSIYAGQHKKFSLLLRDYLSV